MDTDIDLGTIYADAPIEIRARAQEDRLRILKTLEVQAAPNAVVSESPILKISGRCMSRRFIRQMCRILKIRCLSRLLMPKTEMRRILKISGRCLSRLLTLPVNVTVSPEALCWKLRLRVGAVDSASKSVHIAIVRMYSFVSSR